MTDYDAFLIAGLWPDVNFVMPELRTQVNKDMTPLDNTGYHTSIYTTSTVNII